MYECAIYGKKKRCVIDREPLADLYLPNMDERVILSRY